MNKKRRSTHRPIDKEQEHKSNLKKLFGLVLINTSANVPNSPFNIRGKF